MSYEVVTKINGVVKLRKKFGGVLAKSPAEIVESKPCKSYDREYYYFVLEGNPVKADPTDRMTIEAKNI